MTKRTLDEWLDYQLRVHPREIDLGLDRVRAVWQRMGAPNAPRSVIVGGTNGKGSTVAFLEAMLEAAGYRVGAYTSPHLLAYNERVRVDGADASDADLCAAFERIEHARGETELTYFEFGTLAALDLFARAGVDVALLEVGLGGRLDATNIVDADAAIVTTVDLDHQSWLGPDRDSIGAEKGGIARAGRPLIVGELDPPEALLATVNRIGARVQRNGVDYHVQDAADGWVWQHEDGTRLTLPNPALDASAQRTNAAAAIATLHALDGVLPCTEQALAQGVRAARVRGRLQRLAEVPELIVDVAHNPQAAGVLAQWLDEHPVDGPVHAVFGALDDKDVGNVYATLGNRIAHWHLASLTAETSRGLSAQACAFALPDTAEHDLYDDVGSALHAARRAAPARIVAFGSFFLVAAVLRRMNGDPPHMP
ncbi:bifunctional tetrahydrofolate synthase/dihydrofolate synthase [Oleiagrimonas sp. MCCC 1A03011]|uniref:bifunctional tetrahydrofolate synthase/dihydrofolate synthase n=1 Tax=Oleiagrimonas sp. MCCC 1A03011 TaxID=1926883 RepID=UPI000DC4FB59|nr:bifunctional tetrahydrofolate synthase/dihydrofolate synthase [Oleiagrimonas sp. MCCC 1A03011]RAP57341.1 bifunctional tetrahydrofolate synthase/dihydrofolate synthase [Oleiagrimonas sp. MCCC 1A03011]